MSYILDALKKSDQERKQGDVPNLQTIHIPVSTEQQTPFGLYGVIAFLLLILAFVIGLVVSNSEPDAMTVVADAKNQQKINTEKAPAVVASPINQKVITTKPEKITKRQEVVVVDATEQNRSVSVGRAPVDGFKPVMQPKMQQEIRAAIKSKSTKPNYNDVPYLNELPDYQQQSVPQMTFAGHVYSSDSDSRSVIINDVFMSEGDTLLQGIDVIEITPSGVVFSLHDDFFRMDILQDWSFE